MTTTLAIAGLWLPALSTGEYRLGRRNVRLVRCAACGAGCLPGQARALHLLTRLWRAVWLCTSCCPKEATK